MTDFVELRRRAMQTTGACCLPGPEMVALLDEVERLRAGMREYACTGTDHPCGCYEQFLSERAEIERLRAERNELFANNGDAANEIGRLRAENKQMHGALVQVRARFQNLRLGPDEELTLNRVNDTLRALEPKP